MTDLSVIVTQTVCCFVRLKRLFSVIVLIIEIAVVLSSGKRFILWIALSTFGTTGASCGFETAIHRIQRKSLVQPAIRASCS